MLKKGELTTQQIVGLVVLIASFSVLLYFIFSLNLGGETENQLCRNSVIQKGIGGVVADSTSLKCKTNYVCISGNGECEGLTNPEIIEVESQEEVYKTLAEEMRECWWMFGEGKVNYVEGDLSKSNYCSICSQVFLDKSLREFSGLEDGILSKDGLYNYLSLNKIKGKNITYSKYLFGDSKVNEIGIQVGEAEGFSGTFGVMEVGKSYFNVMGITSERSAYKWALGGSIVGGTISVLAGVAAGVVGIATPIGWVGGALVLGGTVLGGVSTDKVGELPWEPSEIAAITVEGRGIENQFISPTFVEVNSDKFKALNCEEIITLA